MKILIKHRTIIATTNDDKETLRVLYNAGEFRSGYIIWKDQDAKGNHQILPPEYSHLEEHKPTAFLVLNNNADLEAPGSGVERAKEKITKEIAEIEKQSQESVDELFGFLK